MELTDLLPGIIGSFVGVMGWLLVGLYIQRRQFVRQARNAAKAVYFELDVNRIAVSVAYDHGSYTQLNRSSFERLLPELATLLSAADLKTVVGAYMAHAGYEQLATDTTLPASVRRPTLANIASLHDAALAALAACAFTRQEAHLMKAGTPATPATADDYRRATS